MRGILFDDYLKGQLKDPEFKKLWDESEPAFQAGCQMIEARMAAKITQKQLAKKAKTTQAVISRIENMSVSPTIGLLQKLATAMGKKLQIKFV